MIGTCRGVEAVCRGRVEAVSRPCRGRVEAVSRLCRGCVEAVSRLRGMSRPYMSRLCVEPIITPVITIATGYTLVGELGT